MAILEAIVVFLCLVYAGSFASMLIWILVIVIAKLVHNPQAFVFTDPQQFAQEDEVFLFISFPYRAVHQFLSFVKEHFPRLEITIHRDEDKEE